MMRALCKVPNSCQALTLRLQSMNHLLNVVARARPRKCVNDRWRRRLEMMTRNSACIEQICTQRGNHRKMPLPKPSVPVKIFRRNLNTPRRPLPEAHIAPLMK